MKNYLFILTTVFFLNSNIFSQDGEYQNIDFNIIAKGNDSPFKNLQIVCFNKYFNLENLPKEFQRKYHLTDPKLFKQKMLVEVFYSDVEKKGLDAIEIVEIKESTSEIIVNFNILNSDSTNDTTVQSPFIVVQIPKSQKEIRFIANGQELQKGQGIYIK